jgi:hypothetical protein
MMLPKLFFPLSNYSLIAYKNKIKSSPPCGLHFFDIRAGDLWLFFFSPSLSCVLNSPTREVGQLDNYSTCSWLVIRVSDLTILSIVQIDT